MAYGTGGDTPVGHMKGPQASVYKRWKRLENDRSSWRSHWMEISDYLIPRRGRYLMDSSQYNRGKVRNSKIIDSSPTQALRTMAAGMMSGMTSPARPWFRFHTADPDMMRNYNVKAWVQQTEAVVRRILNNSNFYNTVYNVYQELGAFGTAPLYRQRSPDQTIRFRQFTAGEYVIAENDQGQVDTLGREFTMTVAQVVERFVMFGDRSTPESEWDWTGVSDATKRMWNNGDYDSNIPIIHMIQPRASFERDPERLDPKNKKFKSCYFELGGDGDEMLEEGGYDTFPAYVPRWDVLSGDIYGRSPAMDHLGDIKQLQHEQKRKAQAIDKMVNPPMVAPASLRGRPTTVIAGGTTYVDPTQGATGFQPAYQVTPRVQELMMDIQEVQQRISRGFYADLFAMMISSDRRQITATEVAERHEEKLVLLGPVLQRLNVELLDPLLDDTFRFALEAGLIPPPPQELAETSLDIQYVSLLAQAQQAVAATGIERTLSFAGNLVGVFPDIVDNLNADAALREYSDILGNPLEMLRGEDEVASLRQKRAEQMAQQQQMQMAQEAAQSAKLLSETDTQTPNALTEMLGTGATV